MITADRLREVLSYDPSTGVFVWSVAGFNRKIGRPAGCLTKGYRRIRVDGVIYSAHRLAWLYVYGEWPAGELDHEDTHRDHNWIANLRPAKRYEQTANSRRPRHNTSGFKGVGYRSHVQAWRAKIKINGQSIHLGYFDTPEEAHAAYATAAARLFGVFARAA